MHAVRIYFATDIHGSDRCFRKFINAAAFYEAGVLILGGDITGKTVVPLLKQSTGDYTFCWQGREQRVSASALPAALKDLRDAGSYPALLEREEIAALGQDPARVEELCARLACESIGRWLDLAEERLQGSGVECYIAPGNDDPPAIDGVLARGRLVVNPEGRVVHLRDTWEMIAYGTVNHTPWRSPRELTEEALARRLEALACQIQDPARAIFTIHVPPYGSGIDRAPELDRNLKPVILPGGVHTISAGSTAVSALIKRYQPLLALHGHIHEAAGSARIGRTLCLNPGSEYTVGVLRGALVQLDHKGIEDFLLTAG
jgi:Icc-related predicted phosphoesterase